jgi:predicted RNA-binding Zn-ribbon protein involved in translation (DUF1610 family)
MTLMNPKTTRAPWQKNTRTCHICLAEFIVDGRGKRLYCPECGKKRRKQFDRQTYFNRKNRQGAKA